MVNDLSMTKDTTQISVYANTLWSTVFKYKDRIFKENLGVT